MLYSGIFIRAACCVLRVPCSVFRVPCSVFRVPCSVFRVPCSVLRAACKCESNKGIHSFNFSSVLRAAYKYELALTKN